MVDDLYDVGNPDGHRARSIRRSHGVRTGSPLRRGPPHGTRSSRSRGSDEVTLTSPIFFKWKYCMPQR
jgi:hypothetical protein